MPPNKKRSLVRPLFSLFQFPGGISEDDIDGFMFALQQLNHITIASRKTCPTENIRKKHQEGRERGQ
jgi:hypothetical protein